MHRGFGVAINHITPNAYRALHTRVRDFNLRVLPGRVEKIADLSSWPFVGRPRNQAATEIALMQVIGTALFTRNSRLHPIQISKLNVLGSSVKADYQLFLGFAPTRMDASNDESDSDADS